MSQPPGMPDPQAATEFQLNLVQYYVIYATSALAAYEYLITLGQEVNLVWQRQWTGSTWLFLANRYIMLGWAVVQAASYTPKTCVGTAWIFDFFELAPYVITATFSALRVYAICGGNLPIALVVLISSLVPVAINIYTFSRTTVFWTVDPVIGPYCNYFLEVPGVQILYLSVGARVSLMLSDLIVIVVTWVKTFRHTREAARLGASVSLSATLLRDGSVYFVVLLVFNIAQILVKSVTSLQTISPIFTAISILSPILLSRFLLSLRRAIDPPPAPDDDDDATAASTLPVFGFRTPTLKTVVGDMGAQLVYASGDSEMYGSDDGTAGTESTALEFRTVSDGPECEYRHDARGEGSSAAAAGSSDQHFVKE